MKIAVLARRAESGSSRPRRVRPSFVITAVITPTNLHGSCNKPKQRNPAVAGFFNAPERTRTSTAYKGHKALNLVRRVKETSVSSICRVLSAGADNPDVYGEAFGITLVSRRTSRGAGRGDGWTG
jgi:hypothetical protein